MLTSTITDTALLFEGGGMRASYTSPVASLLLREQWYFDHVSGISAGASTTANYLSRDRARADECFVEFATDPQFGDWRTFVRGEGIFNSEYIYLNTSGPDQALPFDWDTFAANPAQLRIAALDVQAGELVAWQRSDITVMADLMVRVRASSSMPVLMPAVEIDGRTYVDGALGPTGGIPLDLARMDGYERFFVVMTRTRDYVKQPTRLPRSYRALFRKWPAVADAVLNRWQGYNATREELFELEAQGKAYLFFPDQMPVSNGERKLSRLRLSRELGYLQAEKELPRWREFLAT